MDGSLGQENLRQVYLIVSKARHRGDILEFNIHHGSNLVIKEHRHDTIGISLNRLVRSSIQLYTRTDSDYRGPIPKGDGFDVQFNVTDMVIEWIKHPLVPQEIVIKTTKQWMRQIITLDSNSKNAPYIEIQTKEIRRKRAKRQLDCAHTGETRCCRYPLRVDFRQFGWDWVIAPDVYDAYYCSGECPQGYLPRYHHSYVSQLGSSFSPCCSPKKLSSLSLLYYDSNKQSGNNDE
ncbi:Growth/differentiation factor 8 [Pseudolycoriella hygida]|uniref:Growth/differentiation factor 8 n=1 Tax=Pseudolycoriella hygida TaxID=35572 RepID=A0A9Q0MKZ8_9DIPT|nr:Growth/differentiation factor 8 [Pseudolycoriella hygida]